MQASPHHPHEVEMDLEMEERKQQQQPQPVDTAQTAPPQRIDSLQTADSASNLYKKHAHFQAGQADELASLAEVSVKSVPISQRLNVSFENLTYTVLDKRDKTQKKGVLKQILKGVSGYFQAGRLSVVMGASGAGKTSLLNVLAGEVKSGSLSGSIHVNGQSFNGHKMKKISGFVFQDDVILDTMTVREAITMSALLRLPEDFTHEQKLARVDEVISLLHLEKAQNTLVGSSLVKGISGGERKRTSIAMELVTNPSILFLDEPTSGLDSFTAYSVVRLLKSLTATGRTVICTLHQPSSEIFHLFDDFMLLADGQVMYSGLAADSVPYFAKLGYECPQHFNPSDYFFMKVLNDSEQAVAMQEGALSVLSQGGASKANLHRDNSTATVTTAVPASRASDAEGAKKNGESEVYQQKLKERVAGLLAAWQNSEENRVLLDQIHQPDHLGVSADSKKHKAPFREQFGYLFGRAWKNALRNKFMVRARFGQSVFFALIVGLVYLNVDDRTGQAAKQDRTGSLFFLAVNMVMSSCIGVLNVFAQERAVFIREYSAGYYSLPSYFFSKFIVESPFNVLFPFVTGCISYWMIGFQHDAGKFFIACLILILLTFCGSTLGICFACIFPVLQVALTVTPMILLPLMLFGGLFVNSGSIPPYFDWIKYLSPIKYGFTALIKNEFTGLTLPNGAAGEAEIANLGLDGQGSIAMNAGVLVAMTGGLVIISYFGLWRLVRNQVALDLKIVDNQGKETVVEVQNA